MSAASTATATRPIEPIVEKDGTAAAPPRFCGCAAARAGTTRRCSGGGDCGAARCGVRERCRALALDAALSTAVKRAVSEVTGAMASLLAVSSSSDAADVAFLEGRAGGVFERAAPRRGDVGTERPPRRGEAGGGAASLPARMSSTSSLRSPFTRRCACPTPRSSSSALSCLMLMRCTACIASGLDAPLALGDAALGDAALDDAPLGRDLNRKAAARCRSCSWAFAAARAWAKVPIDTRLAI